MAENFKGTYHLSWEEDRARHMLKILQERWGEAELWKLNIGPKMRKAKGWDEPGRWSPDPGWRCYIIKKPGTPTWECKEAHINDLIGDEDNWEKLDEN